MNDNYITFYNENGEKIKAEVLFTHHSIEFNKDYIVFIPEDTNSFAAAIFNVNGDDVTLDPIEDSKEWEMLEEKLREFIEENHTCGGSCGNCDGNCDCDCDCEGDDCDEESCCCKNNG